MAKRSHSYLLVFIQLACLGLIAVTGPVVARSPLLLVVEIAGGLLGLWAIFAMRLGNFNVTPDVRAGARFVARGPYRAIRHPMYAALLLITLALLGEAFTWARLAIWLVLAADLLIKLHVEEKLLASHFAEYDAYIQRTTRLIPFIY